VKDPYEVVIMSHFIYQRRSFFLAGAVFCTIGLLFLPSLVLGDEELEFEETNRTSKVKNFGVGGWFDGVDCPGIELFWKFKKGDSESLDASPTAFFRRKDGKTIVLDEGMAIFSADCEFFWFTDYDCKLIKVYETSNGKEISSFPGEYPAWSPDSKYIYMSRASKGGKYELWEWSLTRKEASLVITVGDWCDCYVGGEGVTWRPVVFGANGDLKWTYPTCEPKEGVTVAKVLTIEPSSKKVKKVENTTEHCWLTHKDPLPMSK
jgi:hypothetical protein